VDDEPTPFDANDEAVVPAGGEGDDMLCVRLFPMPPFEEARTEEVAEVPTMIDPPTDMPIPIPGPAEGMVLAVAGRERDRDLDEFRRSAPELG
jgi:hypothetical protein